MSKIKIKNFGPIKEGLTTSGGWLDIRKVTVFIGNQGSGKSTVAKLISTMTWVEKALVRGDFSELDITPEAFQLHCSYQNIGGYFKINTEIEYQGKAFFIRYNNQNVTIEKNELNGYAFPKIMYVPAERNLVGSVRNVRRLKGLPSTLYTFADEYFDALDSITGLMHLPINNASLEYDKLAEIAYIKGSDYTVKLSEASSGFQSFVPLYMVTAYLADALNGKKNHSINHSSIQQEKQLRSEVQKIMSDPTLSEEVKNARLQLLSELRSYSAFVNIVEEPEQNLFPTSQREVLNTLLSYSNRNKENCLVLTTHSPYLINYITLAVKANSLLKRISNDNTKLLSKLQKIVPFTAALDGHELAIYEMNEDNGTISQLGEYNGLPSDDNELNEQLGQTNELFAQLLEIQQQL